MVKSVLTRVVLPRPDSPVASKKHSTWARFEKMTKRTDYHHGEVCTMLGDDFVSLLVKLNV